MTQDIARNYFYFATRICGIVTLTLGLVVTFGWMSGIESLTRVTSAYIPMAIDTALCFAVLGATLYFLTVESRRRLPLLLLPALVGAYGLLAFIERFVSVDLTITHWLIPEQPNFGMHPVNQMSPLSGVLFLLSGTALVSSAIPRFRLHSENILGWSGALVFVTGSLLTYAYALGDPFLYHTSLVPLSLLTAIAFSFVGAAMVSMSGANSILKTIFAANTKGRTLRLFIPLIVLTCFAQQFIYQISSALSINNAILFLLVPLLASIAAVFAGGRLAQYLSDRIVEANRRLEESEEKYRSVVEHSHDMYWTLDSQGRFTYANKKSSEVSGYDMSRWIGQSFVGILHAEDHERVQRMFLDALNGTPQDYEVRVRHANGSDFYVEVTSVPEYVAGQIVGVASFGRDITERRHSEIRLRNSEAMLRASQSVARLGSYELDVVKGVWTSSNILDDIFGIDEAFERTPAGWLRIVHPEWREEMANYFETEVLKAGKRFDKEYKIVKPSDGQVRWVHGLGDVTFDQHGVPIRMIGTIQDITDRKELEAERVALEAQLRQAQKLETIGTLAGGVAHDFNNILTPILVYSEMAAHELGKGHPQRDDIEQVIAAANRAKDLVKQILTFSRQMDQERIPIELAPAIREAMKLLNASVPSSVKLVTSIDTECKPVLANPSQIHQVLLNLCTNALHAMRDGGGTLTVELKSLRLSEDDVRDLPPLKAGEFARLCVSDTGCGIDDAIRDRIFEPFFTTKVVGEGTGLGLSVVHGIVKSHDGAITVKSRRNAGTTFCVYLPLVASESRPESVERSTLSGRGERILVVDDEYDVAKAVADVLTKLCGYSVSMCQSGQEALDLLQSQPNGFKLVITDQAMPAMTGLQLAEKIKKSLPEMPVILMSGFSKEIDNERLEKAGVCCMIVKPPVPAELGNRVNSVLAKGLESVTPQRYS
ncbi:PAS domain S-box protein [bacterium]|nr:PAS domain S-box protein [bacterium]